MAGDSLHIVRTAWRVNSAVCRVQCVRPMQRVTRTSCSCCTLAHLRQANGRLQTPDPNPLAPLAFLLPNSVVHLGPHGCPLSSTRTKETPQNSWRERPLARPSPDLSSGQLGPIVFGCGWFVDRTLLVRWPESRLVSLQTASLNP